MAPDDNHECCKRQGGNDFKPGKPRNCGSLPDGRAASDVNPFRSQDPACDNETNRRQPHTAELQH
jgi:hypothetical protein